MNNVENIDEYIEKQIETKLNNLLTTLPDKVPSGMYQKPIYEYTMNELYKNTLQTVIDIINDISELYKNKDTISSANYNNALYDIILKDNRRIYIGIIFIILSFIIYFVDGASV
jgi:hypothetical protein